MEESVVGGVLFEGRGDEAIDVAEEAEVDVEGGREVTAIDGSPCLEMKVAQRAGESLYTVTGLPVPEATKKLESKEGEGEGRAGGCVGEEAILNETDGVCAAGFGNDEVAVAS